MKYNDNRKRQTSDGCAMNDYFKITASLLAHRGGYLALYAKVIRKAITKMKILIMYLLITTTPL